MAAMGGQRVIEAVGEDRLIESRPTWSLPDIKDTSLAVVHNAHQLSAKADSVALK